MDLGKENRNGFFYSVQDVEHIAGIDIQAEDKTLDEILAEVLYNTGLTYEITHNTVVSVRIRLQLDCPRPGNMK